MFSKHTKLALKRYNMCIYRYISETCDIADVVYRKHNSVNKSYSFHTIIHFSGQEEE